MSQNQSDRQEIRVFDVQDRRFAMWVLALSSAITIGLSLVAMAASFQLGADTASGSHKTFLEGLSRNYLLSGLGLFGFGSVAAGWTNRKINNARKQGYRSYNPRTADNFVVVLEGVGSHGNREREGQVDNILELAIRQIIANGGQISTARFYSSSGVRNLLKQEL